MSPEDIEVEGDMEEVGPPNPRTSLAANFSAMCSTNTARAYAISSHEDADLEL
jgi:hypothetical protein